MKIFINIKETSERLPGKNFLDFGGVPLFEHTLRKFKDHKVYVDSDSKKVIDVCNWGHDLGHVYGYERTRADAAHPNPGLSMTKRFVQLHMKDPDEPFAVVNVCNPFLKVETIESAFETWRMCNYDSICSVNVIRNFLMRKSYHDGKEVKYIPLNFDFRHIPRTQDLEPIYELNHAFFVFSKRTLDTFDNRIGANPYFMETTYPENLDIDYQQDYELALKVLESGV